MSNKTLQCVERGKGVGRLRGGGERGGERRSGEMEKGDVANEEVLLHTLDLLWGIRTESFPSVRF